MFELLYLAAGIPFGWFMRQQKSITAWSMCATIASLWGLLFFLGLSLGADAAFRSALPVLGAQGILLGCCYLLGSACIARLVLPFYPYIALDETKEKVTLWHNIRSSLTVLFFFFFGICMGWLEFFPDIFLNKVFCTFFLASMLFSLGIGLGGDTSNIQFLQKMGSKAIWPPVLTIVGTAVGVMLAWGICYFIFPVLSLAEILTVGAGFGYYSLSSGIIADAGLPTLATIALLANITRETLSIVSAPLLAYVFGPLAPISSAGATSMDSCLPSIINSSGEEYSLLAIFHGTVLTVLVPLLVPLTLYLFQL